jgi:hypothetical protein
MNGKQYVRHLKSVTNWPKNRVRIYAMAATTTTYFPIPVSAPAVFPAGLRRQHRRITPRAGRAMKILGHAIAYLTDELYQESAAFSANSSQMKAVQLLMSLNRTVYFECPAVPTFGERWRFILQLLWA